MVLVVMQRRVTTTAEPGVKFIFGHVVVVAAGLWLHRPLQEMLLMLLPLCRASLSPTWKERGTYNAHIWHAPCQLR